jgi:ribosomal protein L7/L12
MLAALRCPECTAPVRALPRAGETAACAYCGAALTALGASDEGNTRWEHRYWIAFRVGPSNVERIARVLHEHASIDVDDARARLAAQKCELEIGPNREVAEEIVRAAKAGGAAAEIITRGVNVPLWTVTLEDAGDKKVSVIAAVRQAVDFTIPEAKRLVASTPCVIVARVEQATAVALVAALHAAGAKAVAQPS